MQIVVSVGTRLIAVLHLVLAAGLAWLAARMAAPIPHTGATALGIVFLLVPFAILAALAVWFAVLGVRVWRRARGWCPQLRWSSLIVLAGAALQLIGGWLAIRSAERSAARGGGLLGGLGPIEVATGLALLAFAVVSLLLTFAAGIAARGRPGAP